MSGQTVKIRSSEGGEFDCYLVAPKADAAKSDAPKSDAPKSDGTMPAIVLASAVHGVDTDIRAIADEFAANGVIAAAPDLFWRTLPGPLSHDEWVSATAAPTPSSGRNGSATPPAFPAMAPSSSITCRSSTA